MAAVFCLNRIRVPGVRNSLRIKREKNKRGAQKHWHHRGPKCRSQYVADIMADDKIASMARLFTSLSKEDQLGEKGASIADFIRRQCGMVRYCEIREAARLSAKLMRQTA